MATGAKVSDQVSELEIALYFTGNNEETAKAMISGNYNDQYAVKGIFSSSSVSGAFLIFFSLSIQSPTNIYTVATSYPINDINSEMNWLSFEKGIADIYASGKLDNTKTGTVSSAFSSGMSFSFNQDLKKIFESSDPVMINYRFKRLLEEKLQIQQLRLAMDFEPLSSLEIEYKSTSATKLNLKDLKKRNREEEKLKEVISETRKHDNPLAGKDVKMLLNGKFILSPIRGKNISLLTQGDRVRVFITDKSSKAIKVAQAFNAFDEQTQNILPISGRVVSNRFFPKSGYEFYVIVAKGVYLKIMEAQEDIKVSIDDDAKSPDYSQKKKARRAEAIIWACVSALVITGIIAIMLI
ncbi:MAG: hypothetical protein FWG92_02490 [Leptospirales bacterium]|nr:hypothetical protein [Leptospirales bacterium]